jgi:hypothetical protein
LVGSSVVVPASFCGLRIVSVGRRPAVPWVVRVLVVSFISRGRLAAERRVQSPALMVPEDGVPTARVATPAVVVQHEPSL